MGTHANAPLSVEGRRRTPRRRALHAYLRWRDKNARHPDVLAAQRRERARIRSEKGIRWGGRPGESRVSLQTAPATLTP
jgi:hypothetical protein